MSTRVKIVKSLSALMASAALLGGGASAQIELTEPPVQFDGSNITYTPYKNYCRDRDLSSESLPCSEELETNTLRGFSYAGYKKGGVALPVAEVGMRLKTGSGADDLRNDDESAAFHNFTILQNAINSINSTANSPRAILLPKGKFYVTEGLAISKSGVVLRGQGQSGTGTVLVSVNPDLDKSGSVFLNIGAKGSKAKFDPVSELSNAVLDEETRLPIGLEALGTQVRISQNYVPTGSTSIKVRDTSAFSTGGTIFIALTPTEALLDEIIGNAPAAGQENWGLKRLQKIHERKVRKIEGNKVFLDAPLLEPIYAAYGGGYIAITKPVQRISEVGVENIRIETNAIDQRYRSFGSGSATPKTQHTRSAISFYNTENSWVSGLTCRYLSKSCVRNTQYTRYVTVQDAATVEWRGPVTGGRRYTYQVGDRAYGIFFQRIYSRNGRHDLVAESAVSGPVVWLDTYSELAVTENHSHKPNSIGMLFDNASGGSMNMGFINASSRGYLVSQGVLWNSEATRGYSYRPQKQYLAELIVQSRNRGANFNINSTGDIRRVGNSAYEYMPLNEEEKKAMPRSLYLAEIEARKGKAGLRAITTDAQRKGTITDLLKNWAGNGALPKSRTNKITLTPIDDTYVKYGSNKNTPFAMRDEGIESEIIGIKAGIPRVKREALMKFDLNLLSNKAVTQAKLKFNVVRMSAGPLHVGKTVPVTIRVIKNVEWDESTLTAAEKLERFTDYETITTIDVSRTGEYQLDVTPFMQTTQNGTLTFELLDDTPIRERSRTLVWVSSSEGANPPELNIQYLKPGLRP